MKLQNGKASSEMNKLGKLADNESSLHNMPRARIMSGRKTLVTVCLLVWIVLLFRFQPFALATCEYGIHNNGLGGIYIDINSDLYNVTWANKNWAAPYMPNGCTWFVGARVAELTNNPKNTTIWNGENWWNSYGESLGYTKGTALNWQYKAVVCWNTHVAIIEDIHPDGTIILSEGGVGGPADDPYRYAAWGCCHLIETTESELVNRGGKVFLGYIYLDVFLPSMDLKAQIDRGNDGVYCVGETVHITPSNADLADNYWLRIYRTPTAANKYEYWSGQLQDKNYDLTLTDEGYYTCNYYFPTGNGTIETKEVSWRVVTEQTPTETYGTCGDNITWRLYSDSLLIISGSGEMSKNGSTLWGTNVKNVFIGDGITSIGEKAFLGCSSLLSIRVPDSVTEIGLRAFSGCAMLEHFTIPPHMNYVGAFWFEDCSSLKEIAIPDGVTFINDYAFRGCSNLETVAIPYTVTRIGYGAFYCCSSLRTITIPEGVTSIGYYLFWRCSSLIEINVTNSTVSIPYGITSVPPGTFYGCSSLSNVSLPNSITKISTMAFQGCKNLQKIVIPDAVTSIGTDAFTDCPAVFYAFYDSDGARALGQIYRSFLSPDPKYPFELKYFQGNLYLLSVYDKERESYTIPDNTYIIYQFAFSDCSRLKTIEIPDFIFSIGYRAFENCTALESVKLPSKSDHSTVSVSNYMFSNCSSLTSVTFPHNPTVISEGAFQGCSSLQTVEFFDKVLLVEDCAFQNCSNLLSISFQDGLKKIGENAFAGCTSLTDLTIPKSIEKIGKKAFDSCNALTTINYDGFQWHRDKIEIDLGNEPLLMAQWIYPVMNILVLPEKLEEIDNEAFTDLPEIRGIRIPETVTEIAEDAFDDDITIFTPTGSYAARWGAMHGFDVVEE